MAFLVYVYPAGEHWFEKIEHFGREETNGMLNVSNKSGSFYLNVLTGNVDNFTIIIEENIVSIPEFPSWIILPLFLTIFLSVILFRKKYPITDHKNSKFIFN